MGIPQQREHEVSQADALTTRSSQDTGRHCHRMRCSLN